MDEVRATEVKRADTYQLSGVLAGSEIDSQIATAKKYPRDISKFKAKLTQLTCVDRETAQKCFYRLPRKDRKTGETKYIEGASIRFAELALRCYQNVQVGSQISHTDDRYVYSFGMARDLENNTAVRFMVRRRITDRNGRKYNDDMIQVTANACSKIAIREAVLTIIGKAYTDPIVDKCKLLAKGDAKTLEQDKKVALDYFDNLDVTERQILKTLGRKSMEDVTKADILTLHGYATSIKDGEAEIKTIFEPEEPEEDKEPVTVAEAITGKKKKRKTKKTKANTNIFD